MNSAIPLLIVVTADAPAQYTARVVGFSDLAATGTSAAHALAGIAVMLADESEQHTPDDPWQRVIGMAVGDPTWDAIPQAIAEDRRAIDAATTDTWRVVACPPARRHCPRAERADLG